MKYTFVVLLLTLFHSSYSQHLKKTEVKEITNKAVVEILTRLQSHIVISGKKLTINVFKISNGSGSAHVVGDDEISETYFFTVTDAPADEGPIFKVFSLGPFYGPKIIKTTDLGDNYVFTLEHYNSGKREIHKIIINLNKIIYQ
ncbi:hypothetical protein [Mucilaginibacter arboris]|uniref:Uncharacterized protein n=1 Tax=Mucilaginibacter arboris TaxID=2682090 RepID=A0A7K1SUZ9_9SPHI|nr:hypothetical protein [Mucilaginibacter arboris]MVN21103.1 hypothetical protein [Mucilaginibacter arboris]